ncbi:MAG: orotate phosphoribosyltransferase [Lentisphaerae bacterium GWF2_52_8]|nr:MAG: orotate phosphoribosyltransferase [Lentisphaerae bacterium GWF2_52_8]
MTQQEIIDKFMESGALLEGHFLLRSGLHSNRFFQAALLLQHPALAEKLCAEVAKEFRGMGIQTVISPALGGLIVGQEVGRALGVRAIFAEKDNDNLVLRRGFTIAKGEKVLVAEDVVTRGGRVQQTIDLVRQFGGEAMGIAVLVDRSGGAANFDVPMKSLIKLELATYQPESCPLCAAKVPLVRPGSK